MGWSGTTSLTRRLAAASVCALAAFTTDIAFGSQAVGFSDFLPQQGSGAQLYEASCTACHDRDGRGRPPSQVGFELALPDFTDCNFAAREPDSDWFAVIHEGGPARGFDRMMPAFGEALSDEQIQSVLDHVRQFCSDNAWPRGDLNLPRALVTEKAYPEDEAVLTTAVTTEGPGSVVNTFLYEKRFGARGQVEVKLPLAFLDTGEPDGWKTGFGDLDIGFKYALLHSLRSGSIFALGADFVFPTGDEQRGFGKGTTVFEPYLAFGQFLPLQSFLQLQGLTELPADRDMADELGLRAVLGRSWNSGRWGRSWTPMLELLVGRELESGADTNVDLLPQLQVTLNTRQHVMANLGVRLPLTNQDTRDTQILVYLLWDWFDGGFFDGW